MFIRQPQGSNLCGQAIVAMVTDCTLDEAIERVGKKGKTKTRDLVRAFNLSGIQNKGRLFRGSPTCDSAVLSFRHPTGARHWVLWHKKKFYDPAAGVFREVPRWLKLTSHLPFLMP